MTLFTCPWSSTSAGVTVMGISKKGIAVNGQRSAAGRAPWRPAAPTARRMLSPSSAIPSRVSTLVGGTSSGAIPRSAAPPLEQRANPGPRGLGVARKAVTREVEEVTRGEPEDVQQLRLAGLGADPREGSPPDEGVEKAGFSHVGAPHEGDLGEPGVGRLERIGEAPDELDRQPLEDHASLIWRGRSVTTIGGLPSVMHSGVTITSRTSSREGRSN